MEQIREPVPTWMYRARNGGIEDRLFEHPDDIPEGEGWRDTPAAFKDGHAAVNGEAEGLAAPYGRHGFHKLRLELQRRTGKGPRPGTKKTELIAMLEATD